jgi:predicted PurR-regulated permease PerM
VLQDLPEITPRRLIAGTIVVAAVTAAFWLLFRFHAVVLLALAAIIIGTAIRPAVNWLAQRGIPKPAGILAIFGLTLAILGVLLWLSVPVLADQSAGVMQNLEVGYAMFLDWLAEMPNILLQRLSRGLPRALSLFDAGPPPVTTEGAEPAAAPFWAPLATAMRGLLVVAVVLILAFFWTLEGERLKQASLLLIPNQRRVEAREWLQEIELKVGRYVLGQGALCLIIGVMAFVAYSLIGLPNVLLLAIFAGLMEAIPVVGPVLGAVPALVIALSVSPLTALWVLLATVIIQQLENSLLVPRIMTRAVGVNPLVTLLALLAFGSLFGLLGALIALPLAAVIQLIVDRTVLAREGIVEQAAGRDSLSRLSYQTTELLKDLRSQVRDKDDEATAASDLLEDELEAIVLDLQALLTAQAGEASKS